MAKVDLSIAIGGAAGQGIATPGDILARIFVRRGLHLNAYNAYQSIVRGGHIFLTLRTSDEPVLSFGDKLDIMIPLNQDTMNRHLGLMKSGSAVLYNGDKIKPGEAAAGVQLCPFSVKELAPKVRGDLVQNTIALAAVLQLIGVEFKILEDILTSVQKKRPSGGRRKRRRGARGLRLRCGAFQAVRILAARHRKKTGVLRRQPGAGDGRRGGGRAFLLRLSDEPCPPVCFTGWRGTRASWASWCARWKTRSALSTWPSALPMPAAGRCARPRAAALR